MSDAKPAAPSPAQLAQQARAKTPVEVTGAQSLVLSLEAMDVDTVFGIPGGAILPAYDPLLDSVKVRHILVRHEQGAGHAAEGYAAATGRVGVCMATSGPGRHQPRHPDRRRPHGLGPDGRDHRPGRSSVDRHRRLPGGRHPRHHDADHQAQLPRHRRRRHPARRSPRRSTSPRPAAPARCSSTSPRTRCRRRTTFSWPPSIDLPGYRPVTRPHGKQIREAARLIAEARAPGALRRRRRDPRARLRASCAASPSSPASRWSPR